MSTSNETLTSPRRIVMTWLAGVAIAAITVVACAREDYEPDPKPQTLVPCDPSAAEDDPLACPPDASTDAGIDARPDAPPDAPVDASPDAVPDA